MINAVCEEESKRLLRGVIIGGRLALAPHLLRLDLRLQPREYFKPSQVGFIGESQIGFKWGLLFNNIIH